MEELRYEVYEVVTNENGKVLNDNGEQMFTLVARFKHREDAETYCKAVYLDDECYEIV